VARSGGGGGSAEEGGGECDAGEEGGLLGAELEHGLKKK